MQRSPLSLPFGEHLNGTHMPYRQLPASTNTLPPCTLPWELTTGLPSCTAPFPAQPSLTCVSLKLLHELLWASPHLGYLCPQYPAQPASGASTQRLSTSPLPQKACLLPMAGGPHPASFHSESYMIIYFLKRHVNNTWLFFQSLRIAHPPLGACWVYRTELWKINLGVRGWPGREQMICVQKASIPSDKKRQT